MPAAQSTSPDFYVKKDDNKTQLSDTVNTIPSSWTPDKVTFVIRKRGSTTPISTQAGSVAGGGSAPPTVDLDASVLDPGLYDCEWVFENTAETEIERKPASTWLVLEVVDNLGDPG